MTNRAQINIWLAVTIIAGLICSLGWAAMIGVGLHYHPKPPLQEALRYVIGVGPLFLPVPLLIWMRLSKSQRVKQVLKTILFLLGGGLALLMFGMMIVDGGGDLPIWLTYIFYGTLAVYTAHLMGKSRPAG